MDEREMERMRTKMKGMGRAFASAEGRWEDEKEAEDKGRDPGFVKTERNNGIFFLSGC